MSATQLEPVEVETNGKSELVASTSGFSTFVVEFVSDQKTYTILANTNITVAALLNNRGITYSVINDAVANSTDTYRSFTYLFWRVPIPS